MRVFGSLAKFALASKHTPPTYTTTTIAQRRGRGCLLPIDRSHGEAKLLLFEIVKQRRECAIAC